MTRVSYDTLVILRGPCYDQGKGGKHLPTETFTNLSAEKRRRIFDAAVQEFAARRFSDASINQVIKAADISRGSFYQYFADKEDLYLYVLTEIGKEKLAIAGQQQRLHPEASFFEVHEQMMESILLWARERPLYHQIGLLMDLDDSAFMTKLRQGLPDAHAMLRELIERDKQRGLVRADVDASLVVELFTVLLTHAAKDYYAGTCDEAQLIQKMNAIRKILKEGVAHV